MYQVQPAQPSEDASVQPAAPVEAAIHPEQDFAPPPVTLDKEASYLSIAGLSSIKSGCHQGKAEGLFFRRITTSMTSCRLEKLLDLSIIYKFFCSQGTEPSRCYSTLGSIIVAMKYLDRGSFTISPRINTNEARKNLMTILWNHGGVANTDTASQLDFNEQYFKSRTNPIYLSYKTVTKSKYFLEIPTMLLAPIS